MHKQNCGLMFHLTAPKATLRSLPPLEYFLLDLAHKVFHPYHCINLQHLYEALIHFL